MCGYCCGGTPVEKRGEGHRGCSVDCYNVPRPKPATRIAQLEADLAAARSALGAVEALADADAEARLKCASDPDCPCAYKDCFECGKWHNCTHTPYAAIRAALATPPQPAP